MKKKPDQLRAWSIGILQIFSLFTFRLFSWWWWTGSIQRVILPRLRRPTDAVNSYGSPEERQQKRFELSILVDNGTVWNAKWQSSYTGNWKPWWFLTPWILFQHSNVGLRVASFLTFEKISLSFRALGASSDSEEERRLFKTLFFSRTHQPQPCSA